MKFKAALYISFQIKDKYLPQKPMLIFTKNQLFYQRNANIIWQDSHISDGAHYKLIVNDKNVIGHRYEIKVGNSPILGLQVKGKNEIKLKLVHGLYRFQKEPLAFAAIIISILTLLATIVLGVLTLKCK
jgi:hypothetical protein